MSKESLSERCSPAAKRLLSTIAGQCLSPFGNGTKRPSILARWMTLPSRKKPKLSAGINECKSRANKESIAVEEKKKGKMVTIVEIEDSDDEVEFGEEEIDDVKGLGGDNQSYDRGPLGRRHDNESPAKPSIITVSNNADQSQSSGTSEGMLVSLPNSPMEPSDSHKLERRRTTRHSLANQSNHDTIYSGKKETKACSAPDCPNCAVNDTSYCFLHERYGEFLELEENNRSVDDDFSDESDFDNEDYPLGSLEREPLSLQDVLDRGVDEKGISPYFPTCMAITIEGTRCSMLPRPYNDYCSIHLDIKLHGSLKDPKYSNQRDRWFKGQPGKTMCRAITRRKTRCKHQSIALNDMCSLHIQSPPQYFIAQCEKATTLYRDSGNQPVLASFDGNDDECGERNSYDVYDAALSESEGKESDFSSESSNSGRSSPYQYHEDDVMYSTNKTEERCMYVSGKGNPCFFRAVKDSVYCHGHAHLLDTLNPELKQDYLSGVSEEDSVSSSDESSEADCDDSSSSSDEEDPQPRPYRHSEFLTMWRKCEEYCGVVTDDIENTKKIRSANQAMCPEDTDGQAKAQYGRLLPRAMKKMIHKILALKADDIFLDIGHGIGNTCLQAAFTTGCEARGIEVVYGRNSVAEVFRDHMFNQRREESKQRIVGKVSFRHGRLEDETHRDFLTKGVTRAYVNNFNGVFAERSSKLNQKWFLDDYVCGLFGLMEPGTILVTFHPLNLGPTQDEVNSKRRKHELGESPNASFFTVEKVLLGKAYNTVKWNQHSGNENSIFVYKYTRLPQPAGPDAVFLCCNRDCEDAKNSTPIKAVTINDEGRCVMNHCKCKFSLPNTRRQVKKNYSQ